MQMLETLILDSRGVPIDAITRERTMIHMATNEFKKHVRVISEHEDRLVRGATKDYILPSVLQLVPGHLPNGKWTQRIVKRAKSVRFNRRSIVARDGGLCQYCGEVVGYRRVTFDHVTPRSQGGKTEWANIVLACLGCNQKKGGRTPEQAGMKLLSVPQKPSHSGYFFGYFEEGMPESWRPWLPSPPTPRDAKATRLYWNARLQNE